MLVAVVCEGPTDFPAIRALIAKWCPAFTRFRLVQPDQDELMARGGWKAVRRWCEDQGKWLDQYLGYQLGDQIDLLVVQVDGDIASQVGVETAGRSAAAIAKDLCDEVKSWFGTQALPAKLVITIPMTRTETWLLAAVEKPNRPNYESIERPEMALAAGGWLQPDGTGDVIKDLNDYRDLAAELAPGYAQAATRCGELQRFEAKIKKRCPPQS